MVDVGGSSVTRSSTDQSVREFDVAKEHDILGLLQFVRRGPFDDTRKTELRDTILDFATTRDEETLKAIAERTKDAGVILQNNGTPIIDTPAPHVHGSRIGASRPLPTFGASTAQTSEPVAQTADHTPDPSARTEVPQPATTLTPEMKKDSAPASTPASGDPEPQRKIEVKSETLSPSTPKKEEATDTQHRSAPTPEPVSDVPPAAPEAPEKTQQPPPPQEPTVQAPAAPTETKPATSTEPTTHTTADHSLQRIKEIKQSINEKVGNPVNLIDANNDIGREYMNALLNAMRVSGGENRDEISLAMDRLEQAYKTVNDSLASGETVIADAPSTSNSPQQSVQQQNTPPASSVSPKQDSVEQHTSGSPQTSAEESSAESSTISPVPDADAHVATDPPPGTAANTHQSESSQQTSISGQSSSDQQVPLPASDAVKQGGESPQSIAERLAEQNAARESLLHKRAAELRQQENVQEHSGDPLYTNEISAGLQQLLSEWQLFKGSGIFGTGPSGYEHPLYKKLSAMPMAAIIAGRFEGATQEVKQSIADYMNGWRYEQSIVHEMNETFEHYLRRVVKEILEKQKGPEA